MPGVTFDAVVVLVGVAIAMFALALRLVVHIGATPSGVDTWYYLASADELRRTRRLPISLPRYLLQDRTESYPPGFIAFLALFPSAFLRRAFWLISPLVDALHLLLLYAVTYRITGHLETAALGGLIYAVVPQLIAETRSLNPRSLGVLLASVAMYLILRFTLPAEDAEALWLGAAPWYVGALALGAVAAVFLTHSTSAIALGVGTTALTLLYQDWRYLTFTLGGFLLAFVLTRGFYADVLMNHVHAVRFWRRNGPLRGADPIEDSPVYGSPDPTAERRATRWRGLRWQFIRLVGENPFVIPMVLAPLPGSEWWGGRMHWWALAVLAWATATTVVPQLRAFGPGYIYLKASIFPTAFTLAMRSGFPSPIPVAATVAVAFGLSLAAVAYFVFYTRTRSTERTSSAPPGLVRVAARLRALPGDGVLVLPPMYADYVCYNSGKRTLWGGHSGDLTRFEAMFPVIRVPLDELIAKYDLRYALLDLGYVTPERLGLRGRIREIAREDGLALYATSGSSSAS